MTKPKYLDGCFLVAEAELGDPNFNETVVLIVSHDDQGAFGLVINRRSEVTLGEAAPIYHDTAFARLPLYIGGPVQPEYLFTLHSGFLPGYGSEHQLKVIDGVVFEPVFETVEKFLLEKASEMAPQLRLISGYSGWGPGQLEAELAEKAWMVMPATADLVFNPKPTAGWKAALRKKGGIYWVMAETGIKPSMN